MIEPFILRALAAAIGLAVVAAPLGAIVVWSRMAYFGEAVAQASLLGVALGLALNVDITASVLVTVLAVAGLLILLGRQTVLPTDSILGLTHHGTLALGVIAMAMLQGPSIDLVGYLFGDLFAIAPGDLYWVYGGGAIVFACISWLWQPLLRLSVHADLAAAEGVAVERVRAIFVVLLALFIAVAIKIVGVLLAIAFLIVPAVAARPLAETPESMVVGAMAIGAVSAVAGLSLSMAYDVPGGPSVVLSMTVLAGFSLAFSAWRAQS